MYDFKTIVVGLELDRAGERVTSGSQKAARQALWVARANEGRIHFVHSTYDDEFHGTRHGERPSGAAAVSATGRAALDEVVGAMRDAGVEATLEFREDRVWLDIIHVAMRHSADLVVVGKRDEAASDGRRLGNVATKLLRKCPTPVWVVKPDHDLVHTCVLAATDLEATGDLAVRFACYVARRHECALHVVHAWQMPFALQMEASRMAEADYQAAVREIHDGCVTHVRDVLAQCDAPADTHVHTTQGAPAGTIQAAVDRYTPDLLVMGTVSRVGLAGVLVGSTAERLLDRVDCSILAVKPDDFVSPVHPPRE